MRKKIAIVVLLALILVLVNFPITSEEDSITTIPGTSQQIIPASVADIAAADKTDYTSMLGKVQVPFVQNEGQVESDAVKFYADTFGGRLFVKDGGVLTYTLAGEDKIIVLKETFSNLNVEPAGTEESITKINYFKGNNPENWKTDLSTFNTVSFGEISDGISLDLKAYNDNVEKIFRVQSGANPNDISVSVEGADSIGIADNGKLELNTSAGPVSFTAPIAYQVIDGASANVDVEYSILNRKAYGFEVGTYDPTQELIIDPLLASTYVGSYSHDYGHAIAVSSGSQHVYIVGQSTEDSGGRVYYTTPGAYDTTWDDSYDVIVSKLTSDLAPSRLDTPSALLASTFIGADGWEKGKSIEIDSNGDIVIAGLTTSTSFPVTSGAYDESHNGGTDLFVCRMDADLSTLIDSTFIGGSSSEYATSETNADRVGPDMAIDSSGNIYLGGTTYSSDFPVTPGSPSPAYQPYREGDEDAYVCKISNDLTTLLASTYLGGDEHDRGIDVAVDDWGHVFIAGITESTNNPAWSPPLTNPFPVTSGAYDVTFNDSLGAIIGDGFVSRFDNNLETLEASTFIGSSQIDKVWSMTIDSYGYVYIGGYTYFIVEPYFPTTSGAYDETPNGGTRDAFVSKFSNDLSTLEAGTFLGGSGEERVNALTIDAANDVWATGYTSSNNFPTTPGAYDEITYYGGDDAFISKLSSDLTQLMESTHIGGKDDQIPQDILVISEEVSLPGEEFPVVLEDNPTIYITGSSEGGGTTSTGYPTTSDAFDRVAHNYDVLITIFGDSLKEIYLTSCDVKGVPKDDFMAGEKVYVRGTGLDNSTDYTFYIMPDGTVTEGYDLAGNSGLDPSSGQETNATYSNGVMPPVEIWNIPIDYSGNTNLDIIADIDGSGTGTYNIADDPIDSGTPVGFTVSPYTVDIEVFLDLQGTGRPTSGWEVPITVELFNPGSDVMSATPLYSFNGTTSLNTDSGTRAYFLCPDPVTPGTYDITADSTTTLLNVKRNVGIW